MVYRAVVEGVIATPQRNLQVATVVEADILNDGASLRFRLRNDEAEGLLNISQFHFSLNENVAISSATSNVGDNASWAFAEMRLQDGPDFGFGATGVAERLTAGQVGTFTVNAEAGTFTEDLLVGARVCLVYERGTEGQPGFIQGTVCGNWIPGDESGDEGENGLVYPFDRSLARMERSLGRLLNRVQENATFPQDLPEVEKILKLIFLKNQLITILAQESRQSSGIDEM